jgi:RHS repeat-associated protein
MGTYKQSAPSEASSYKLIERPIYGSSRVGIDNTQLELIGYTPPTSGILTNVLGLKQYEFTNHLGNVLTTVSDKKIPVDVGNDGTIDYYVADITSASDYYPFGSPLDGRTFSSDKYRFGFNGQEKDDEVAGAGNYLNFKYRLEDSRLCRFFAIDPLSDKYPELTPYQVASLNPIWMREIEGLEGKKPPYNNGDSDKKTPLNTLALPSLPNSNPTKNKNIPGLNTPPQSQEPIKQDNTAPAAIGIVSNQIVNSTATHQEATSGAVLGVTDALDPIAKIAEVNGAKWAPNFSKGVTGVQVGFIFKDFLDGKYQEAATGVADLASGTVGLMFKISYAASQTEYGLEGTGDVLADDRLFNLHQWKVTGDEAYLNKAIVSEKALITVQQKLMLK